MDRHVSYSEFRHAVLQYRPSNLLPFLADYSAAQELRTPVSRAANWFPWAVSAIAKESVLGGNEFLNAEIDDRGLERLVHLLNLSSDLVSNPSAASLMTPIMYEQFPYQESLYEEMARTHALLVHNEPGQAAIQWDDLLGLGLDEAIRASMVLHAWVVNNAGRFDPGILDMAHFQQIYEKVAPQDRASIRSLHCASPSPSHGQSHDPLGGDLLDQPEMSHSSPGGVVWEEGDAMGAELVGGARWLFYSLVSLEHTGRTVSRVAFP